MRADRIKQALAYVHTNEAKEGRREAARFAAHILNLTEAEREVLERSLNLRS